MKLFASLQNRVFLASAAVAVIAVGSAIHFVTQRVAGQAEAELRRGLQDESLELEHHFAAQAERLILLAHLLADLPKLKAAVETGDPPTVEPILDDYRGQVHADVLAVTNPQGQALWRSGQPAGEAPAAAVQGALQGRTVASFAPAGPGVLHLVTVPIDIGTAPREVLGTLSVGFALGDALAAEFKAVSQSEVVLLHEGRVVGSTLPREALNGIFDARRADPDRVLTLPMGENEYMGIARSLAGPDAPVALILRSRTERLRFLGTFRTGLLLAALVAVVMAVGLSYAVALTVTRPLRAISATMREMTATGDLARKIRLPRRWGDEDAVVLSTTFNTLTDAIARFQQEAALRERLSALGRLSTVIAHEVRNPLMIIKGALRTLRRGEADPEAAREALEDIDNEVARLNRIVGDVLDFARPIRLDLAPGDVNALCRQAAAAAFGDGNGLRFDLSLDPALEPAMIDAERLRTVLVNVLTNAREAVLAHRGNDGPGRDEPAGAPDVELSTRRLPSGHVEVAVVDRGAGIDAALLPHVFEPYFTTKRTGTGLGLAIAKNIVDALGGSLSAANVPGRGTEVRLELPLQPAPARGEPPARVAAGGRP
jgi:signal transduction histidine kinase